MANQSRTIHDDVIASQTGRNLGSASIIFAVASIVFYCISMSRIHNLQTSNPQVCLVSETPIYVTVNTLGPMFSAASAACGIIALTRCRRQKVRFSGYISALAGIFITLTALTVYFFTLVFLAEGQSH